MYKVLLLNSSFEPLNICNWKRAVTLLMKGKAEQIEHNGVKLTESMHLPTVIRLKYYVSLPYKDLPLNRTNIFHRDQYTCQYCNQLNGRSNLTIDHVIPRSKGGEDTWENVVSACMPCNTKKGNKTPQQIGMKLLNKPGKPKNHIMFEISKTVLKHNENADWDKYLVYYS